MENNERFNEKMNRNPTQSDEIKDLISALSKAQGAMKPAVFNRINPHYKNRYADFTSCMECCREPLSSNGLSIMQYCEMINDKLMLVTMLAHVSGQWMKSYFPLNPVKMDSQSIGSAMTYGKRYSLSAMLGIVSDDEDDDGEAAHGRSFQNGVNHSFPKQQINGQIQSKFIDSPKTVKIASSKVAVLRGCEEKLDDECKRKIYSWLLAQYKINNLEDITDDIYQKVLGALENAVKFMEQQKLEVASV